MSSDDEIGDVFGSEPQFSVGVEEELFLVDPVTGRQVNSSAAVLELLARGGGAGRQHAAYEIAGMDGLLRELTQLTGAGAGPTETDPAGLPHNGRDRG